MYEKPLGVNWDMPRNNKVLGLTQRQKYSQESLEEAVTDVCRVTDNQEILLWKSSAKSHGTRLHVSPGTSVTEADLSRVRKTVSREEQDPVAPESDDPDLDFDAPANPSTFH
ncbi:Protein of unknown function [Gryllus bimaculatus]|nr:Protein of unknown function [Gryllus bimaculatus]